MDADAPPPPPAAAAAKPAGIALGSVQRKKKRACAAPSVPTPATDSLAEDEGDCLTAQLELLDATLAANPDLAGASIERIAQAAAVAGTPAEMFAAHRDLCGQAAMGMWAVEHSPEDLLPLPAKAGGGAKGDLADKFRGLLNSVAAPSRAAVATSEEPSARAASSLNTTWQPPVPLADLSRTAADMNSGSEP